MVQNQVLILADERVGTYSQAVALAEELGLPYQILKLKYGFLANFPNLIFRKSLFRLKKESRDLIKSQKIQPLFVISSGRKSASIALYLKDHLKNYKSKENNHCIYKKTYLIQIMNPEISFSQFDFVVIPNHDQISQSKQRKFSNLILTIGALTRISNKLISSEQRKFGKNYFKLDDNKLLIAVLMGGSSKKTVFNPKNASELASLSCKIAENMNAELLLLTSPRTGKELLKSFRKGLTKNCKIFDWWEVRDSNPYFAAIGFADYFIITGDSVSMISDCCSTGKPVYIFTKQNLSSKKHNIFHADLVRQGFAQFLEDNCKILQNYSSEPLNEVKKVADFIRKAIDFS